MSGARPAETVAAALTRILAERGVGHAFGIPGDYVLGLCAAMEAGPLDLAQKNYGVMIGGFP